MQWLKQPTQLAKTVTCSSITQAIQTSSPNLAIISKTDIELTGKNDAVKLILAYLIGDLVNFFNVGKNMTPQQIGQTIDLILENHIYRNLKPEDYKVCFNLIKSGYYSSRGLFDRFDGNVLFLYLNEYCEERMNLYSQAQPVFVEGIHPRVLEVLAEAKKQLPKEDKKVKTFKPQDKTQKDILIQSLYKEFFELWSNTPQEGLSSSGKFVVYKEKMMNESKYVQVRLEEEMKKELGVK